MEITAAGTISDLVADAVNAGYDATTRLVRDWTSKGLLDHPARQPRGRGKGSKPALYTASQRMLFLVLLHHRRRGLSIPALARIPVSLWLYVPEANVTAGQAKRAFATWLADPRSSKNDARHHALETTAQLTTSQTTRTARRTLTNLLADIAYRGELNDEAALRDAIREVFEPEFEGIAKSVGHPAAPLSTNAAVDIIRANLRGVRLVTSQRLSLAAFAEAGRHQRETMAEYARDQPALAAGKWGQPTGLYEEPSIQWLVEQSCSQLLTMLGFLALTAK